MTGGARHRKILAGKSGLTKFHSPGGASIAVEKERS